MNLIPVAASSTVTMFGVVASIVGFYWLVNKRARLKHLTELRRKLDELSPSDPEYGAVRALYTSMTIDAERWGFFIRSRDQTVMVAAVETHTRDTARPRTLTRDV
jgi:hypothetical protein